MHDDPKPDNSRPSDPKPPSRSEASPKSNDEPLRCDYCGSTALVWRRCKLICENCRGIVLSCGDL